jgi:hypothetical protein
MRERSIAAGAMAYKQLKTEVSDKALARFSAKKLMSQHKNPPARVKLSSKLMLESREAAVSKSSKSAKTNKTTMSTTDQTMPRSSRRRERQNKKEGDPTCPHDRLGPEFAPGLEVDMRRG